MSPIAQLKTAVMTMILFVVYWSTIYMALQCI